jgi:phosphate-selective porin OprO/OprP
MIMKIKLLTLSLLIAISGSLLAQTRNVTGVITSNEDNKPVPEVTVRLKGAIGTFTTNDKGEYSIPVDVKSTETLIFNHPDYEGMEVVIIGKSNLDLTLSSSVRFNQYGAKVSRIPLDAEARNGILTFESKDKKHRVWYDVRVQADGAMFFGDTYNEIGNGTSIRRARFAVKTEFNEHWYGEFDLDISNSELELKDAYVQYQNNKGFEIRIGNFKEVYSMESTTTSRYLTFMERPMAVHNFAPSRHVGIGVNYSKEWLFTSGGIHFQGVDDVEDRMFSKDNNKDFGMDEGYSVTGKVVVMPWASDSDKGLHIGVAGSYRTPKTTTEYGYLDAVRYSVRSLSSINRKKYLDTDLITKVDYFTLGGLELAGYYKGFRLQSEYLMSNVYRFEDLPTEKFSGFYVFGSMFLFGGSHRYNSSEAEFTQPVRGKSWGDVEIALRYDYLSLNSAGDGNIMGGAGEGYTFGLNLYPNSNVKVMLNYAYLNHDRYANGKNKLYVGYNAAGELTTSGLSVVDANGTAGEDFSFVSIRFEVDF